MGLAALLYSREISLDLLCVHVDHNVLKLVDVSGGLGLVPQGTFFPPKRLVEIILVKDVLTEFPENELVEANESTQENFVARVDT